MPAPSPGVLGYWSEGPRALSRKGVADKRSEDILGYDRHPASIRVAIAPNPQPFQNSRFIARRASPSQASQPALLCPNEAQPQTEV